MRPATNYILSDDPTSQKLQLEQALRDLAQGVNGITLEYIPTIKGSTTKGTVTYSSQKGWYIRQSQMIDYWFNVSWTNWVGGVGNIRLNLPSKIWMSENDFFVGDLTTSNIAYANAADTNCVPVGINNSYQCNFMSSGHNRTYGYVQVQTTGTLTGHIRYLGQLDK